MRWLSWCRFSTASGSERYIRTAKSNPDRLLPLAVLKLTQRLYSSALIILRATSPTPLTLLPDRKAESNHDNAARVWRETLDPFRTGSSNEQAPRCLQLRNNQ